MELQKFLTRYLALATLVFGILAASIVLCEDDSNKPILSAKETTILSQMFELLPVPMQWLMIISFFFVAILAYLYIFCCLAGVIIRLFIFFFHG